MRARVFRTDPHETARVEAFSDGVLAIVITLLVLEIQVPEHALDLPGGIAGLVRDVAPQVGAWMLSFLFVLVFWVAHHSLFGLLERGDRGLLWLNGLFLFCISFTPFPTAVFGTYPQEPGAAALLALAMFATAASISLLRWYATFPGGLVAEAEMSRARRAMRRSVVGPLLYLLAAGASSVSLVLSVALQALVPVIFFFPVGARDLATPS